MAGALPEAAKVLVDEYLATSADIWLRRAAMAARLGLYLSNRDRTLLRQYQIECKNNAARASAAPVATPVRRSAA